MQPLTTMSGITTYSLNSFIHVLWTTNQMLGILLLVNEQGHDLNI